MQMMKYLYMNKQRRFNAYQMLKINMKSNMEEKISDEKRRIMAVNGSEMRINATVGERNELHQP